MHNAPSSSPVERPFSMPAAADATPSSRVNVCAGDGGPLVRADSRDSVAVLMADLGLSIAVGRTAAHQRMHSPLRDQDVFSMREERGKRQT